MNLRDDTTAEIAAVAARLVVDEGQEYAAAKRQALRLLNLPARTALPDNDLLEAAVREHIAVFCADTQPHELRSLRAIALQWMDRLQAFRPHVGGAVWHGTATRHSDIYMHLFCDDPKQPEWVLLDHRVDYHPGTGTGFRGEPLEALTVRSPGDAPGQSVLLHLLVHDHDALRGALKPDAQGRKPRGDAAALRALMAAAEGAGA